MSEDRTEQSDESEELEEREEARPGSVLAKATVSFPSLPVDIEFPIEAQAKIAKIVEDQVTKEVDKRLAIIVAGRLAEAAGNDSRGRYSKGFYMSAGLSGFAGLLGYSYFGGYLGF